MNPFTRLASLAEKPERLVAGLMSGTSADAIDVAVCRMAGPRPSVSLVARHEVPLDPELKRRVIASARLDVAALAELHVGIGEAFAAACLETLDRAGLSSADVDLIGSHGQTVYHHSGLPGAVRATLQLGDGDVIAVRTGCFVLSDFRSRDVAAGGEGAPLSPIADALLFSSDDPAGPRRRAVLNLGGIANLTVLDPDPRRVFGFDTGPANAALDRLARRTSGGALHCDRDGAIARAGRVDETLLASLLDDDPFLKRRPPKSTGFEMYGDAFLDRLVSLHGKADADLMATLTEFTARSVALAFRDHVRVDPPVDEVVVAGGGVHNPVLMDRLAALLAPVSVVRSDALGIPSDAREAIIFAVLADLTLRGIPAWLPPVTGASGPKLLGKLSFP